MTIQIELAKETDDQPLRRLMAQLAMPGFVRIAYQREPSYFDSLQVEGRFSQTLVARDTNINRIVGMGTRSIKPVYVSGRETNIGYLSGLRLLPDYRNARHLARGYRLLRQLHEDGRAQFYLTTVLNSNDAARKLKLHEKTTHAWHALGQYRSMAISLNQPVRFGKAKSLTIRTATKCDLPNLVRFLNREGRRKQFFPVYAERDFTAPGGLLKGLKKEDVLLGFDGDELRGVVAAWDQRGFRQSMVSGYSPLVGWSRSMLNLFAPLFSLPRLPAESSILNYYYLALTCVCDDDPQVFAALLEELMKRKQAVHEFMMAGMHERDPLLPVLQNLKCLEYPSLLYAACWEDGKDELARLDGRVPYLELGGL